MISPYDNATQTCWDRGEFKVQLNLPNNPRPMGFCDGSPEDVAELLSIAEAEGADEVKIHSFQTLMSHLSTIVRNTCRRAHAGPNEQTFIMDTPPDTKQREAYELLLRITL